MFSLFSLDHNDVLDCSNSNFNICNSFSSCLLKNITVTILKFSTKLKIEETSKLYIWLLKCSFRVFIEILRIGISSEQNKTNSGKNNAVDIIFAHLSHSCLILSPTHYVYSVQFYAQFFPPSHIQSNLGFSERQAYHSKP